VGGSFIQQNSRYLSGFIRLDDLAQNLLQNAQNMRFEKAILFRSENGDDELHPYSFFGYPPELVKSFSVPLKDPIIQRLILGGKPCTIQHLMFTPDYVEATPEMQALIDDGQVRILLPLLTRNNKLLGVLALGPRQSNETLAREDWDILDTLADQTSLAIENIHLVETLQQQLDVMRQIQQELHETKWRLADSREQERLELARLLHDGPIQDIYGVVYQLEIWRKINRLEDDSGLRLVEDSLMDIEKKLRVLSTELRPPALETFGLVRAIRSHARQLQEKNPEVEIKTDLNTTKEMLSVKKKLALFRIYQESIRNVIRHADADFIWVRLYGKSECVVLEVEDNGRGYEPPSKWMEFARQGHFGILGMAERAESFDGRLEVISKPGQGTLVRAFIPVDESG